MNRAKNEVGNSYGLLTVVSRGENTPAGSARWLCSCSCGNPELKLVSVNSLRSGVTKSCGCIRRSALKLALNTPDKILSRKDSHIKRIQSFGRVELVGDYIGDATKTTYKCLTHNEIHEAVPTSIARGHGLKCCQISSIQKSATTKSAAAEAKYLDRIKGSFLLKESYKGKDVAILHYCLAHGKVYRASPAQINKGSGLQCCGEEKLKANGLLRRQQASAEYDQKISGHGRVVRIGSYIASDVPIMHLCLEHNERHEAKPDSVLQGCGLRCCFIAGRDRHLKQKSAKAHQRLIEFCKTEMSMVEYLGGYEGFNKKAMFMCQIHGQAHSAIPSNILKGGGLICCKRRGSDSIAQVFDGSFQGADKNEWLYLHKMKRFAEYLKLGISDVEYLRWETDKDKEYGEQVHSWWFNRRIEAFVVEQAVLHQTESFWAYPRDLKRWAGFTEIRKIEPEKMVGIIEYLVNRFHEIGIWQFMLDEIPLSPAHKAKAEAMLTVDGGI